MSAPMLDVDVLCSCKDKLWAWLTGGQQGHDARLLGQAAGGFFEQVAVALIKGQTRRCAWTRRVSACAIQSVDLVAQELGLCGECLPCALA